MPQNIHLVISGRSLLVSAQDDEREKAMRAAAELINQRVLDFDRSYPDRPLVDKLAYVAIAECASKLLMQEKIQATAAEVADVEVQMDNYLKGI